MSITTALLFGCVFALGIYFLVLGVVKMTTKEMNKKVWIKNLNPKIYVLIASLYLGLGIALLQTYPDYKDSVNTILTVMTVVGFVIAIWDFLMKGKQ